MEILETLKNMPVSELFGYIALIVGVISIIVEKSKKLPFNPWSALFRWIGSKLNDVLNERLDVLESKQNEKIDALDAKQQTQFDNLEQQFKDIQSEMTDTRNDIASLRTDYQTAILQIKDDYNKRIDKLEYDADEKEVKRLRSNIICFADSCRSGSTHYTKQHFENIFRDYDDYLNYCSLRKFQNHFIDGEMEYVKTVYAKFSESNSFK